MITDVPITVCGMIICEGSKGDEGVYLLRDGEQVQLDISELEGSSIFPGMICAVEGVNLTGKLIVVSKIHQLTDQGKDYKQYNFKLDDKTRFMFAGVLL